MKLVRLSICFLIAFLPIAAKASIQPGFGTQLSYALIPKEPMHTNAFQLLLNYQPEHFIWQQWAVYVDGGFAHLWVTDQSCYSAINIYTLAPVVRYHFQKQALVLPYIEMSIGLSYLTGTHLASRNLGIHFAFQDRIGIGARLGQQEKLSIGFHAVHYSNARLCGHNSGITIPLMFDIGYRFN